MTRELGRGLVGAPWRRLVYDFDRCMRAIMSCSPHAKPRECAPAPPRPVATLLLLFSFVVYYWDSQRGVWALGNEKVPLEDKQFFDAIVSAAAKDSEQPGGDETPKDEAASGGARVPDTGNDVARESCGKVVKSCKRQQMRCFSAGFQSPLMTQVLKILDPELNFKPSQMTHLTSVSNPRVDTNAIVAVSGPLRVIVVAFRGTHSRANVKTDVTFLKRGVGDSGGVSGPRVHEGFHEAYFDAGIGPELEALMAETCAENKGFDVFLTGHSLGGALATVLAYRLSYHVNLPKDNPLFCITFGAPRVGDPSFAAALTEANVRVYRFVNNRDVVPRIPAVNYQHAGVLLWLRHKKKQKVTASGAEAAAATREHQPRSAASSSAAATNSKAAPVVGRVDVYASGTEAPCNQQCLCCNLNVMDHVISFEEVENADGSVSTVPCVGAFEPACGGWNPLWSTGPLPSPTGATAGADDAQLRRAATHAEVMNVHFNGYMQAILAVPDEDWPDSEAWGGASCKEIKARCTI